MALSWRTSGPIAHGAARRAWVDLVVLTKPKVTLLLLAFGLVAAVLAGADGGAAAPGAVRLVGFAVLGYLAAGGAAALNHLFDRDLDARMERTRRRPVAAGRVSPRAAAAFAATLLAVSLPAAAWWFGPAVAGWMAAGAIIYGGLYTLVLKRSTHHNIVIGGLAGSCGVLAGWSVASPALPVGAWLLALLVFLWTPPHFWGLAIARSRDYHAAGVPMLPQVHGIPAAARAILAYACAMTAASLLLAVVTPLGHVYLVGAAVLGVGFTAQAVATWRAPTTARSLATFRLSGAYLALLLGCMLLDLTIRA